MKEKKTMIWYPYEQLKTMKAPYEIVDANGVYLYTKDQKIGYEERFVCIVFWHIWAGDCRVYYDEYLAGCGGRI